MAKVRDVWLKYDTPTEVEMEHVEVGSTHGEVKGMLTEYEQPL